MAREKIEDKPYSFGEMSNWDVHIDLSLSDQVIKSNEEWNDLKPQWIFFCRSLILHYKKQHALSSLNFQIFKCQYR